MRNKFIHRQEILEITPEDRLLTQLKKLPKIELHRHITGSVRPETVEDILREYRIDLPYDKIRKTKLREDKRQLDKWLSFDLNMKDLNGFVQRAWYNLLSHLIQVPGIAERLLYECIEDAHKDNIKYLELRISPYGLIDGNGTKKRRFSYYQFLNALKRGIESASVRYPRILVKLIISIPRHVLFNRLTSESEREKYYEELINTSLEFKDDYIVGFDLAGKEKEIHADWPPRIFEKIFLKIKEAGFKITIHAGETDSARSVYEAITCLQADRIGHGIKAIEDNKVMSLLKSHSIPLEICPTANIKISGDHSLDNHPIRAFFDLGLCVTVNADDTLVCNTTLTKEYLKIMTNKNLNFTFDEIKQIIRNSLSAAFIAEKQKKKLASSFL